MSAPLFDPGSLGMVSRVSEPRDGWVFVYVGRRRVARVPAGRVEALKIAAGVEWTAELAGAAALAGGVFRAKKKAVALLAVMARTSGELRERLLGAGFEADAVAGAVDELIAGGIVDDAAVARDAAGRALAKGLSTAGASHRLSARKLGAGDVRRGIAAAASEAAETGGPVSESERAEGAARNRLSKLPGSLAIPVKARRLLAHLAGLGYEEEVARGAVQRVLGWWGHEGGEE